MNVLCEDLYTDTNENDCHNLIFGFTLLGSHNWVGDEFSNNGGVGLVVQMKNGGGKIMEQVKAAFERDWTSPYSKNLLGNKDRYNKYKHLHQVET